MRFRLSTLFVVAPLLGLAMFGGLKWYEQLSEEYEIEFVFPCEPLISTKAPVTWDEDAESPIAFPESDFGPVPVERPISLR